MTRFVPLLLMLGLACLTCSAEAEERPADWIGGAGIKFGLLRSGSARIGDNNYGDCGGISLGFLVDMPVGGRLSLGPTIDLQFLRIPGWSNVGFMNGGVSAAWSIALVEKKVFLRPAFTVGAGWLGAKRELDDSYFIVLQPRLECLFRATRQSGMIVEIGLFRASGGDAVTDAKIGSLLLLRAGVLF